MKAKLLTRKLLTLTYAASVFILGGCVTKYQQMDAMAWTGGYDDEHLGKNVYRVVFSSNGYTSQETCQTFWLYRCAELALEKGFDGFEILSDIELSTLVPLEEAFGFNEEKLEPAQYFYYIPMDTAPKPLIRADILLLSGEVEANPPKVFNAKELKKFLEPHVQEPIEKRKNVIPHIHEYLYPEGKLPEDSI